MSKAMSPELLERLLTEHGAALELFAMQWTHAPDDCVQDAFLQLVRQPKLPRSIVSWLYRVVRNRAISMRRMTERRRRHESLAATDDAAWFEPARGAAVDKEDVVKALQALDDRFREVVVARIWGELSFEEIAEVVGTSISTAHRRYEAALRQVRERLGLSCPTKKSTPKA